ncbi:hypothetical protein K438DRAFT_1759125 [Mycena galopus ATCC 62051]|nr:hypothetical protein K438DRAFT_1759125 [Mycena galopus ATCC 62051]
MSAFILPASPLLLLFFVDATIQLLGLRNTSKHQSNHPRYQTPPSSLGRLFTSWRFRATEIRNISRITPQINQSAVPRDRWGSTGRRRALQEFDADVGPEPLPDNGL